MAEAPRRSAKEIRKRCDRTFDRSIDKWRASKILPHIVITALTVNMWTVFFSAGPQVFGKFYNQVLSSIFQHCQPEQLLDALDDLRAREILFQVDRMSFLKKNYLCRSARSRLRAMAGLSSCTSILGSTRLSAA